ncbi:MAG: FAD-dependent oxidoreductase [Pirellulales bacterium]|nr:FAD-dependent oxidoreductase [Pirellulales bacterium]
MPTLTIDQREVTVPAGATILEAAERLGIEIPTLCFLRGYEPSTSCLVCMVKLRGRNGFVPACATRVADGMQVESETAEVHQVRRTALELLLSDHVGDCLAPCHFACPAHMDIPLMLRQISAENYAEAIVTVKRDIALPAVLGRVCPKPCEKGCRRNAADGAVAVCQLKRFVADLDLASQRPFLPECRPDTGKRVAIVGAGPTGLSAAYYLRQKGHAVTVFEAQECAGGRLLREVGEEELPRDVLDAEIGLILAIGVELNPSSRVEDRQTLDDLRNDFDAVLLACGAVDKSTVESWGLRATPRGVQIDKDTYQTSVSGVFAAGNAIRGKGLVVRSVADGKEAAAAVDTFLAGRPASAHERAFSVRIGRLEDGEIDQFLAMAGSAPRREPLQGLAGGFLSEEAVEQASRCLHCDCRALGNCKLRRYGSQYGADPNRFRGERAAVRQYADHPLVVYEPGKCIDCGLCIQIATRHGEPLGLTFVGRGFDVRIGVPFNRSLEEALGKAAAECVAACPTAALALKKERLRSELPILGQR